ncbi:MAG TPA: PP2C family serine/threonine-protein phosphatase [Aliidongia sp.]|nr:PP2C family serine/threonine-protein phosphatase [Aliidongia sp.]
MCPAPTAVTMRDQPERLLLAGAMQTHPGRTRLLNEDVVAYVLPRPQDFFAGSGALAIVADGMGGHAAGEVASRLAADVIRRRYYELAGPVPDILAACFAAANSAVYERGAADPELNGMGTTCTVLAVRDGRIYLGHVGDSRAYILRGNRLRQISQDHSVVAELVRSGAITAAEASKSPYRNVVLRALGIKSSVEPLIWSEGLPVLRGDSIVLCSDGLSDLVDDTEIADKVGRLPPAEACRALIAAALAKGGRDNISLGVFTVGAGGADADPTAVTRAVSIGHLAGDPK